MSYLVATVSLLSALCLLNLVLSYGVIRRLRVHSEILAGRSGGSAPTVAVGSRVDEFAATATDGTHVSRASIQRPTLVGFFKPGCAPCEELIPSFAVTAADPEGVRPALAVVVGTDPAEHVRRLASVTTVVTGEPAQAIADAFGVQGYPSVCVVGPGGTVLDSGRHLVTAAAPALA